MHLFELVWIRIKDTNQIKQQQSPVLLRKLIGFIRKYKIN